LADKGKVSAFSAQRAAVQIKLKSLTIRNFKSLRQAIFTPSPLTALIGPNASGKSNFAQAINFISNVYGEGLEAAVVRAGGYENIAFRKGNRSESPLEFEVVMDTDKGLFSRILEYEEGGRFRMAHRFSVRAKGTGMRAVFRIEKEIFTLWEEAETGKEDFSEIIRVSRLSSGEAEVQKGNSKLARQLEVAGLISRLGPLLDESRDQTLLVGNQFLLARPLIRFVAAFRAYQISVVVSRSSSAPAPNPALSRFGAQLPTMVDWLQQKHPKKWEIVFSGMKEVLPGLTDIIVQPLHTRTLGLFFQEEGFGRPWNAEEVSDGTIQALAVLVAAADPRSSLLVIDEVETSVHPWILRTLVKTLRAVSKTKNVVVTSHSPVLLNQLKPEEVWVIYREKGASQLRRLVDLDPSVTEDWEEGAYQLADYLDSGAVGQAVPGGVW
jgi:predicted ATPase